MWRYEKEEEIGFVWFGPGNFDISEDGKGWDPSPWSAEEDSSIYS